MIIDCIYDQLDFCRSSRRRRFASARCAQQHQHAKHEEHDAPDEIDVHVKPLRVRGIDRAEADEQHADEREHEADWPADVESHKISLFLWLMVHQKIKFRMTQAASSTVPTTAGRCQTGTL